MKSILQAVILLVVLVSLSFLLYGNTISGAFVYDDQMFSLRPEIRRPGYLTRLWFEPFVPGNTTTGSYRPFALFTFALNYVLFGPSPVSFHIINIILNGIAAFLVYLIIYALFHDHWLAGITALLFLFFPIHTEAVASIKSRDEILSAVFRFLSWLVLLKAIGKTRIHYLLLSISACLYFLGILSKEFAIVAPVLFIAVAWVQKKLNTKQLYITSVFFAVPAVISLVIRYMALGTDAFGQGGAWVIINPLVREPFITKLWTIVKICFIYAQKILVPYNLSATHAFNHVTLVTNPFSSFEAMTGIMLLGILVGIVLHNKTRSTPLGIGALCFLIPLSVIAVTVYRGGDILAERWMYKPSLGIALILAYGFMQLVRHHKVVAVSGFILLLVVFGYVTVERNEVWLSSKNLAESMLRDAPDSVQSNTIMAEYLIQEKKDFTAAKPYITRGMQMYAYHPPLLDLFAMSLLQEGKYDMAYDAIVRAILIRPRTSPTYLFLYAVILTKQGKYQESIDALTNDQFMIASSKNGRKDITITMDKRMSALVNTQMVRFLLTVNYYKLGNSQKVKEYSDWNSMLTQDQKIKILEEF